MVTADVPGRIAGTRFPLGCPPRAMGGDAVSRDGLAGQAAVQGARDPLDKWGRWTCEPEALLLRAGGSEPTPGVWRGGQAVLEQQRVSRPQAGGNRMGSNTQIVLSRRRKARRARLRSLEVWGCVAGFEMCGLRRKLRASRSPRNRRLPSYETGLFAWRTARARSGAMARSGGRRFNRAQRKAAVRADGPYAPPGWTGQTLNAFAQKVRPSGTPCGMDVPCGGSSRHQGGSLLLPRTGPSRNYRCWRGCGAAKLGARAVGALLS